MISLALSEKRGYYRIIYPLFFLSGACSLAYEMIWIRMFIPIFGIGLYSVSAVVSSFMGGLAVGSYIYGKIIDGRSNLLRYYALFELFIGAYAVILPLLIKINYATMPFFYNNVSSNFYVFSIFRFILAFFLLIAPCSLMGATLPVMSRFFIIVSGKDTGREFSFIYALNVLGAVCGCAIAAFFLLYKFGAIAASYIVSGINIAIGISAFLCSFRLRFNREADPRGSRHTRKNEGPLARLLSPGAILGVAFLSGFCALSFELLWVRALANFLPDDVYLFPVILIVILTGNSLGYLFASAWITKIRNHAFIAGALMIISGMIMALSLRYIPFLLWKDNSQGWYMWVVTVLMVLPASFAIGMIFPNLVSLSSSGTKNIGRKIGSLYSANTVGAISGSFFTAFISIPFLGLRNTLFYCILASISVGALVSVAAVRRMSQRIILASCLILSSAFFINKLISINLFRDIFRKYNGWKNEELVLYREGVLCSLGVFSSEDRFSIRYSGGSVISAEVSDRGLSRNNHRLKAHIPMILHPDPRRVVNIGFGTGVSAYSLTLHNIDRADNVEICAETLEASGFFLKDPENFFKDRATNIIIDDGRNFLFVTDTKYDIIFIYPFSPVMGQNIFFYTRDFLELCREKLNPGGLISIWFPPNMLGSDGSQVLLKTFLGIFPDAAFFSTMAESSYEKVGGGGFLVASAVKGGLDLSSGYLEDRIRSLNKSVRRELAYSGIYDAEGILKRLVAGRESLFGLCSEAKETMTDSRTILDYRETKKRWSEAFGRRPPPQFLRK